MTRTKKLLTVIAAAAGVYLTATTAVAEPLLATTGRPACGNVQSKGSDRGKRARRIARAKLLREQLALAESPISGSPALAAELRAKIENNDACIAVLDEDMAAFQAAARAQAEARRARLEAEAKAQAEAPPQPEPAKPKFHWQQLVVRR